MPGVVSRIISLIKSGKQHVTAVNKSDDLVKGKDQKLGTWYPSESMVSLISSFQLLFPPVRRDHP